MIQRISEGNSVPVTRKNNYFRINDYSLDSTDSESGVEKTLTSLKDYGISMGKNFDPSAIDASLNKSLLEDTTIESIKVKAVEIVPRQEQSLNMSNSAQSYTAQSAEASQSISAGDEHWYSIDTTGMTKLTGRIIFSSNLDMQTAVFKFDGTPVTATPSNLMIGFDQFAFFPEGGLYYIAIVCNSGSGDYNLDLMNSTLPYTQTEVNDNVYQVRQEYTGNIVRHIDTFDNDYDHDWFKWENPESGTYQIDFYSQTPFMPKAGYEAILININTWNNWKVTKSSDTISLTPGTYYIFLKAENMYANQEYIFSIVNDKQVATRVDIDRIDSNEDNTKVDDRINYNYGKKWRVRYGLTATGTAYNKYGQPLPNGEVFVSIDTYTMGLEFSNRQMTNGSGRFSIDFDFKGHAYGELSYRGPNSVSTHYFSIDNIYFWDHKRAMISSGPDTDVYHFAYQI